ncbi:ABC transporter permease [Candidatus Enterococcus ferrettii]|uniref:ABC transporter permease n=1 Tax=Candidatus Enterococcus ferrettii TaxID=2815324 RepID=A0ABV0ET14_9ENTE|nr:ABC transporter permease [Enterococcus sp. 665A]MBO1342617.1 hypothetical protein [Enterococcus sp. 665A]
MRIWRLFLGDIKFQAIYGFYLLYGIVTFSYGVLLLLLPQAWRAKAAVAMIYSDPAALGLVFMGAIILLEKSQRVLNALAVSPVNVRDYLIAKICSLCLISVVSSLVLAIIGGLGNLLMIAAATTVTSLIFSLLGLIVGAKISSLNHYMFAIVPLEIICFVPPLVYLFEPLSWLTLHPLCGAIALINESSSSLSYDFSRLVLLSFILFAAAQKSTSRMWQTLGGVKI